MYTLFYSPGTASLIPHMLLREIGAPFELKLVDKDNNAQKRADYLALNPSGQIPVLIHDGVAIHETAAIALFLADRHPEAHLAPALTAPDRAAYLKWMILLTNALQTPFRFYFYSEDGAADAMQAAAVKAQMTTLVMRAFAQFAAHLDHNEWIMGDSFSAADLYLFMFTRWSRNMPSPARLIPSLSRHANAVAARPAVREALTVEGLAPPYF